MSPHSLDPWQCTLDDFASADESMDRCLELARAAARTDLPTLILGETGTGKTLLARAIHNTSKRAAKGFVSFNAAALSDTLLDSQLFGHERGAFTGADKMVKGKFEQAHGGTLFVDEIADLALPAQAKILRAIEYGEFERLGSERLQVADVRLVAATCLPLDQYLRSAQFRKDLFYRISGITLTVPPLRRRPNDLRALLAAELTAAGTQQGKPITGLSKPAADLLLAYGWPGNLRELKRVVHTAVALTEGDVVPLQAVLLDVGLDGEAPPAAAAATPGGGGREGEDDLHAAIARHIRAVLERCGGNKRQAARLLGISRSRLDRHLGTS
jgi:two-component system response regulator HydG